MTSIFVAKLDFGVTSEQLKSTFEQYGKVLKASVATDRETGKSRGFGFVEMEDQTEARNAISALDNYQFNGRPISVKEAAMVHASVWDLIPYVQFTDGYCQTPYAKRFSTLEQIVNKQKPEGKKIWIVSSEIVQTIEEAQSIFQNYLSLGHEGIILKDGSGVWEDKRSKTQIKFKGELECDLKIVAVEEGSGKAAGMLGAIVCESADGILKVNVGSGFSDAQRKQYWKENLVDKIVAVKYNARIKNKQGEESLFLPVFVEIRDDKDVADSSKIIK